MRKILFYFVLTLSVILADLIIVTIAMVIFGDNSIIAKGLGIAAGLGVIANRKKLKKLMKIVD